MASLLVQIAEAVKESINGPDAQATFSLKFRAERLYLPRFEVKDLVDLKVSVVPSRFSTANQTRGGTTQRDAVIDIGIHRHIAQGRLTEFQVQAECDPLMGLADEIQDWFRSRTLSGVSGAMCIGTENQVMYDPQHISEHRVFFTVVALNFRKLS